MSYHHYGNIGDVWKHLALCLVLSTEKPRVYVETHSAGATHVLEGTPRQKYGVFLFCRMAHRSKEVSSSAYLRLLRRHNQDFPHLATYPGSPALAMSILGGAADSFVFYDTDKEALENIEKYADELGIRQIVGTMNEDSLTGILPCLDQWRRDDLIFFDPYEAFEPDESGAGCLDLFLHAAGRGIKVMLWYGYRTRKEKEEVAFHIASSVKSSDPAGNVRLHCVEIFLDVIEDEAIPIDPGVLGCGVLTANLSAESLRGVESLSEGLVSLYEDSRYEGISGQLKTDITMGELK